MEYVCDVRYGRAEITLKGNFTFKDNLTFKEILTLLDKPDEQGNSALSVISMDFSCVDFVDSAALGMLLLLRDEADTRKIALELKGAKGQALKMFAIARFNVIFSDKAV